MLPAVAVQVVSAATAGETRSKQPAVAPAIPSARQRIRRGDWPRVAIRAAGRASDRSSFIERPQVFDRTPPTANNTQRGRKVVGKVLAIGLQENFDPNANYNLSVKSTQSRSALGHSSEHDKIVTESV